MNTNEFSFEPAPTPTLVYLHVMNTNDVLTLLRHLESYYYSNSDPALCYSQFGPSMLLLAKMASCNFSLSSADHIGDTLKQMFPESKLIAGFNLSR